jgi:hypothetical protein
MQVKIFIQEKDLEELSSFLKTGVNYEHRVNFSTLQEDISDSIEVLVFYDDYTRLKDWKIDDKN